jgi:GTP-binding protein HflX
VGFISELPTQLVAAFRATLEEVISADLIIHVRDISHPDSDAQRTDVEHVLAEIGAVEEGGAPMIEAWNKIDTLDPEERESVQAEADRKEDVVAVSARTGDGIDALLKAAVRKLRAGSKLRHVTVSASDGKAIAWLHANGEVVEELNRELETDMDVRLTDADWERFQHQRDVWTD